MDYSINIQLNNIFFHDYLHFIKYHYIFVREFLKKIIKNKLIIVNLIYNFMSKHSRIGMLLFLSAMSGGMVYASSDGKDGITGKATQL